MVATFDDLAIAGNFSFFSAGWFSFSVPLPMFRENFDTSGPMVRCTAGFSRLVALLNVSGSTIPFESAASSKEVDTVLVSDFDDDKHATIAAAYLSLSFCPRVAAISSKFGIASEKDKRRRRTSGKPPA